MFGFIRSFFSKLRNWFVRRRTGEVRVAPKSWRGRVYINPDDEHIDVVDQMPDAIRKGIAEGTVTVSARVIRANGDTEDLGELKHG
jgi:hypothetical protein